MKWIMLGAFLLNAWITDPKLDDLGCTTDSECMEFCDPGDDDCDGGPEEFDDDPADEAIWSGCDPID